MKVFISWSERRSLMVAEALKEWLPTVIQAVEPFFSPDTEKGTQWSAEIDEALEGTSLGIVCLTRENLDSRWIHFETGALSKLAGSRIWTFLVGIQPEMVTMPLRKFQATIAEKEDVRKMLEAMNRHLSSPVPPLVLAKLFDLTWPALEDKLAEAAAYQPTSNPPPLHDPVAMLEELLSLVRDVERRLETREPDGGGFSIPQPPMLYRYKITGDQAGPDLDEFLARLMSLPGMLGRHGIYRLPDESFTLVAYGTISAAMLWDYTKEAMKDIRVPKMNFRITPVDPVLPLSEDTPG